MNIRIENFPPGITVEEIKDFLGASEDIGEILLSDAGNSDDVVAVVKVTTGRTGAVAIAEHINGRFFKDRRLSAQAMTLINE